MFQNGIQAVIYRNSDLKLETFDLLQEQDSSPEFFSDTFH